jgi:hypothetical protein
MNRKKPKIILAPSKTNSNLNTKSMKKRSRILTWTELS